jgi:eukaryotic-like serine/threonine-protein kinase
LLKQSFLYNVLLIVLFTAGLLFLFFNSLNWLTNHGKQIAVPKEMGKTLDKALDELEGLGFSVTVDSTYQKGKKPLEVLFQEPEAGTAVKPGRTIFLTVNRKAPPSIEMPNLVNLSFRNALLIMHSYNLEMGDTIYRPDFAAGAVLEQLLNGKPINAGTKIPFGTKIDLVIGEGLSGETEVPNLIGMHWADVQVLLDSMQLTANAIWEGDISDSAQAIIYKQEPEALNELDFQNAIPRGDIIDVYISQQPSPELLEANQPGSKRLMGEDEDTLSEEPDRINIPRKPKVSDTSKKRKPVPGMNIHSSPAVEKEKDKKSAKKPSSPNTSKGSTPVNTKKPPVSKPAPKPSNSETPPQEEYN